MNDPAPILLLLPTQDDCRDVVVSELETVFAATPVLRGLLSDDTEQGEQNTLLSRRFPGGSLKIIASRAPRNLRRHTCRILLIDEADAMSPTAEGDPIQLATRRSLSYADRKTCSALRRILKTHHTCCGPTRLPISGSLSVPVRAVAHSPRSCGSTSGGKRTRRKLRHFVARTAKI